MMVWKTRSGEVIPLPKLTSNHLINILRFYERRGKAAKEAEWMAAFEYSLFLRGEMAQACAEQDLDSFLNMDIQEYLVSRVPAYWFLLCLANKRGLVHVDLEYLAAFRPGNDTLREMGLRWI